MTTIKNTSLMTTSRLQVPQSAPTLSPALEISMIGSLSQKRLTDFLNSLPGSLPSNLLDLWEIYARRDQLPPPEPWLIWLLLGGRGSGKTRAGAEWIRSQVADHGKRRIALVAPTLTDAREVMLEGESGLLSIGLPTERPTFISSRRRLEWPNGAIGQVFSAEDPDGLRGPQFDCAWADEFCAWTYPDYALSNLRLGLRLGVNPQLTITTTPKPLPALSKLLASTGVKTIRVTTADNAQFLAPTFLAAMEDAYGGTRLGRQELGGEFLMDAEDALWSRAGLEASRVRDSPDMDKIIVAIDPPVTSGAKSDACGLVVVGRTGHGRHTKAIVLFDGTVQGLSPEAWSAKAIGLYHRWQADYLLVEVNQGGEMVRSVLATVDPKIPVKTVYAKKSKHLRAEPVAALYEQGRVHHVGTFPQLEDELCMLGTSSMRRSPDRADALVWAVTELLLTSRSAPRIRKF